MYEDPELAENPKMDEKITEFTEMGENMVENPKMNDNTEL